MWRTLLFGVLLGCAAAVGAADRVAILDFELYDHTPGSKAEVERTAGLKPALERQLEARGYGIVSIPLDVQQSANSGFGYLWDHPDEAAKLGAGDAARWVLVTRLHKPSALFVYMMVQAVETRSGHTVGNLMVEVKGQQGKMTEKGVSNLAEQIDVLLRRIGAKDD